METNTHKEMNGLTRAALCLLAGLLTGCAGVGPRSISSGRAAYNEAINTTEDEQMLLSIVKGRYGETFSLLAVNGVAANVSFASGANIQAGIGNDDYYMGNLVPFSGGLAYEENPTITYSPVHGDRYLRQLLSPVPLDILLLFISNETYTGKPFTLLANRINSIQNPGFLGSPEAQPDPRFERVIELFIELDKAGAILLVADPERAASLNVLITGYAPAWTGQVEEFLSLLGLPMLKDAGKDIVFPVYEGVKGSDVDGLAISTRSTFELLQIMKASIVVPQEHIDAGVVAIFPPKGLPGRDIHVYSSKEKPKKASVAVKHRDYWFYIDDTDMNTKLYYLMIRTLWSTSIANATEHKAAPVMTIPVSR